MTDCCTTQEQTKLKKYASQKGMRWVWGDKHEVILGWGTNSKLKTMGTQNRKEIESKDYQAIKPWMNGIIKYKLDKCNNFLLPIPFIT